MTAILIGLSFCLGTFVGRDHERRILKFTLNTLTESDLSKLQQVITKRLDEMRATDER